MSLVHSTSRVNGELTSRTSTRTDLPNVMSEVSCFVLVPNACDFFEADVLALYGLQLPHGRNPAETASALVPKGRVQFLQLKYRHDSPWNTWEDVLPW